MYTITRFYTRSNGVHNYPVKFTGQSRYRWLARLLAKLSSRRHSQKDSLTFLREQETQTTKNKQIE